MLFPVKHGILALLLCAALALSWACAPIPEPAAASPRAGKETVFLIGGSWHTEIGLSRADAATLPESLLRTFPDPAYLVFGWGARGYYMAPNPGLSDALRTLAPGPAVMLVMPLGVPPSQTFGAANVMAIPVTRAEVALLAAFLSQSLARDGNGNPMRIAAGPDPGSAFYAATGRYDILHTCNTWTAEALAAAGLPVSASGVVFASGVLRQARPLARSPGP